MYDGRGEPIPERIVNRAGFRVDNGDGDAQQYLILPEVFQDEICKGLNRRIVARALLERVS